MQKYTCINEQENFWGKFYLVSFDNHTGWDSAICVNAPHEQDALNNAADYADKMGWAGYFLNPNDAHTKELESFGEVLYVGNFGKPVNSDDVQIKQIPASLVEFTKEEVQPN